MIFAEAHWQVPYAKIMGCAHFWYRAGSLTLKNQLLRGAMVRDKTRPKPNRSNGRDKSASNSPLIISYRSIINFHIYIGLLGNIRLPRLAAY